MGVRESLQWTYTYKSLSLSLSPPPLSRSFSLKLPLIQTSVYESTQLSQLLKSAHRQDICCTTLLQKRSQRSTWLQSEAGKEATNISYCSSLAGLAWILASPKYIPSVKSHEINWRVILLRTSALYLFVCNCTTSEWSLCSQTLASLCQKAIKWRWRGKKRITVELPLVASYKLRLLPSVKIVGTVYVR